MREMNLQSIRIGSQKRHYDEARKCQNIVNRKFNAERPNQIWVSDVTYYRFKEKQYFICVIIDLYARRVISYKIGYSNNTHLTKETFRIAYESRKPESGLIFHSDQGANYRSRAFSDYLQLREVMLSFSKPGVPYDNSVMESFFGSMKQEELYRYNYRSEREFRAAVDRYIDFYNTRRPHSSLHYKTPAQME
jgi:transposase InsO family protein